MADQASTDIEGLLERARTKRLIRYDRVNGETITLQIGRVLYAMDRRRAIGFLEDALNRAGEMGPSPVA